MIDVSSALHQKDQNARPKDGFQQELQVQSDIVGFHFEYSSFPTAASVFEFNYR
jgi:hypothetical protein